MMSKNIWRELRRRKMGIEPYSTSGIQILNSQYGCKYYRDGNIVTITIDFGNITVPKSGVVLGTLPQGYRPSLDIFARNSYDNQNGKAYVFKNGTVGITSASGTFNYMTVTVSFAASGVF